MGMLHHWQHLRYLFISILCILNTLAQHQVTLNDLPKCAIPCADEAASAFGCQTNDTLCLCAHQLEISTATIQCSSSECLPSSLTLAEKLLSEMCTDSIITTTSSTSSPTPSPISSPTSSSITSPTSSTTIQSSHISTTTTSTSQTSNTSTTSSTTTSTVLSTTPDVVGSLSQTTTQLASSTVVIVTTVVVTPTSTTTSRAGRLDVSISARALFFCLPSLISLVAAI